MKKLVIALRRFADRIDPPHAPATTEGVVRITAEPSWLETSGGCSITTTPPWLKKGITIR